jgi:hypothetical protein
MSYREVQWADCESSSFPSGGSGPEGSVTRGLGREEQYSYARN